MEPKEKALDLMDKYLSNHFISGGVGMTFKQAKRCSLICIDEILQTNPTIKGTSSDLITMIVQTKAYWYRVYEELKKL